MSFLIVKHCVCTCVLDNGSPVTFLQKTVIDLLNLERAPNQLQDKENDPYEEHYLLKIGDFVEKVAPIHQFFDPIIGDYDAIPSKRYFGLNVIGQNFIEKV